MLSEVGRTGRALILGALSLALVAALAVAGVAVTGSGPPEAPYERAFRGPSDDRPNIVLVMADDMRADDLRFAPAVRRLVGDRGAEARNAFSSFPLCCPARASFLTGQYAHNHGVLSHQDPFGYGAFDDSESLATALQRAGYRTGFIGKYLNGYGIDDSAVTGEPSATYVPPGWDDWRASISDPDPGDDEITGGTYDYFRTPFNIDGDVRQDWHGRYQTEVLGDFSLDMAQQLTEARDDDGAPFFMWVSHVAPHAGSPVEPDDPPTVRDDDGGLVDFRTPAVPDHAKGRFDDLIDRGAGMPRPGADVPDVVADKPRFMSRRPPLNAREQAALTEVTRQRADSIAVVDQQVERLVAELERTGEWERTVFVFVSDNGYFLGEHRIRGGKMKSHEPSLRIPMLFSGPGIEAGSDIWSPLTLVDLTATLLSVAEARPVLPADGASRWDLLTGARARGWPHAVLTEAAWGTRRLHNGAGPRARRNGFDDVRISIGLRTAQYSYTRYADGAVELYDLAADPLQLRNLHRSADHRRVEAMLREQWDAYKDCTGSDCRAPLPIRLQVGPRKAEALGRDYWDAVDAAYGWD